MKDELKEILGYIDQFVYVDQTYNDIKLSKIDSKLLLDYITNLQERLHDIDKLSCERAYRITKAIKLLKLYDDKENNMYVPVSETINILQGSEENGNE